MNDHLTTYINDHIAASVAGIDLAKRCLSRNEGTELGIFLERLIALFERSQARLKQMVQALGSSESTTKKLAAWGAEKVSRLKLNDSLFSYSDLSRLEELEVLLAGLQSQHRMWSILAQNCTERLRPFEADFDQAAKDTRSMLEELKRQHFLAARIALCG